LGGDRIGDIVKVIKIRRHKWMGHLFRMQELDPSTNLSFFNQEVLEVWENPR